MNTMIESKTWYRLWCGKITPVQVISETQSFVVTVDRRREKKMSEFSSYHTTCDAAKSEAVRRAKLLIASAELSLGYARKKLAEAEAL